MRDKVENKYTPNFVRVDADPKAPKWKLPEQEFQFYYTNNDKFKHNIDLDLERESSQKRILALKKLYWEYKNQDTFHKAKLLK